MISDHSRHQLLLLLDSRLPEAGSGLLRIWGKELISLHITNSCRRGLVDVLTSGRIDAHPTAAVEEADNGDCAGEQHIHLLRREIEAQLISDRQTIHLQQRTLRLCT